MWSSVMPYKIESYLGTFIYKSPVIEIYPGAFSNRVETRIESDVDFLCYGAALHFLEEEVDTLNAYIFDQSCGRALSNTPRMPAAVLFGTIEAPRAWPVPRLFRAASSVITDITGDPDIGLTFELYFYGAKVRVLNGRP